MRLGRQTTAPLHAHFLPPPDRAIKPTPLSLQAVSKLSALTDAVRLLQAISFAQCNIPHFTCHSSICMSEDVNIFVSQNSPNALRRSLIFLQKMVTNSLLQGPLRTGDNNWKIRSNADLHRLMEQTSQDL
jgi:hypothetical protein